MKRETFTASDGKAISLVVWETENPKAVVQIIHGMSEHIERYDAFARFLNASGYTVAGGDLRAHGMTDPQSLGMAEPGKDLFRDTVRDAVEITAALKERYGVKVILLGHSYGSFLAQEYIHGASDGISGCILSGSALFPKMTAGFGKFVAGMKKEKTPGNFFAGITFRAYDKRVNEGLNAWLSRNEKSNRKYNDDPMCGFTCSYGFYKYFFSHLKALSKSKFDTIRKDLPVLIAFGDEDEVGGKGKLIKPLVAKFEKAGITPRVKKYVGCRHEILNETNSIDVMNDMLEFCDSVI